MTKKDVTMKGREVIVKDEMEVFDDEMFYDLWWN
jgi:hypothetical protein